MSEPTTQGDMLDEMRRLGLVDEDDSHQPELTTAEPEAAEPQTAEADGVEKEPIEVPLGEEGQLEMQPQAADGRTWRGAEQLRPYLCRLEDLKPTPGNPDKGKAHVGRLMGSLERFGQTRAILVDAKDGVTIRAGHHLTRAAGELGWTHIAAIAAEFNSDGEAIAYLMADNRLARVGDEDVDAVKQLTILEEIGETNLQGTGWDLDAVETLRAEAGATPLVTETEPWGGQAAETAAEASARAKALEGYEPHKELPLYMTLPQHEVFKEHMRLLQQAWGLKGQMDTILRALAECYEREAAPVASEGATPATSPTSPSEAGVAPLNEQQETLEAEAESEAQQAAEADAQAAQAEVEAVAQEAESQAAAAEAALAEAHAEDDIPD